MYMYTYREMPWPVLISPDYELGEENAPSLWPLSPIWSTEQNFNEYRCKKASWDLNLLT